MLGRRGRSPVIVGRRRELDTLVRLMAQARRTGRPTVALVTGEAGVGKTRLVRELVAGLPKDAAVLVGTAREGHDEFPYALVRQAVARRVAGWDAVPDELERFAAPLQQLLGRLQPDDPAETGEVPTLEDLSRVAVELVTHLARSTSAVVVFEDLQAADAASLDVFERLAVEGPGTLLVGTARTELLDRTRAATQAVHRLRRTTELEHLRLLPLDVDELCELAEAVCGRSVDAATAEMLHERTAGNPFFFEELVAGLLESGGDGAEVMDPAALVAAPLPASTSEAILQRLDRLSGPARRLLDLVAVLGQTACLADLVAVSGEPEASLVPRLRELVDAGAATETSEDAFELRHALVREAVLGDLLASERRKLHRRALTALRDSDGTSAAALARHAIGADDTDAAWRLARAAAQDALQAGAPREALRMAQAALEHAHDDPTLRVVAARAAERLGELEVATAHAEAWAAAGEAGDWEAATEARCWLSWIRWSAGDSEGAWRQLAAADKAAGRAGTPFASACVRASRARVELLSGRAEAACRDAEAALEHEPELDDGRPLRHAMVTKAIALFDLLADEDPVRMTEPRTLLLRTKQEAEAAGDLVAHTRALNNLLLPVEVVDRDEAWELLQEARELADRHGLERFGAKVAALGVHESLLRGDREAAEAALADRRLRRLAPMEAAWVAAMEVHVAVEGGDADRARAALAHRRSQVPDSGPSELAVFLATAEVELATATGNAREAEAALRRVGEMVPHTASGSAADWWIAGVLALEAGVDPDVVATRAEKDAPCPVRRYEGAREHFRGGLLAALDDAAAAIEALQAAVAAPQAGRPRSLLAAARIRLAELLAAAGERDAARRQAALAADELERWPGPRRDALVELRRQLGDGPPVPRDLLTPREREIVALLARGLSNGEIAQRLYISRKTAASHVSNILAKTGLQRRGQVAAWALHHGLVDDGLRLVDTDEAAT